MIVDEVIGANVQMLRHDRGWSQPKLLEMLQKEGLRMHQTTLSRLEHGERAIYGTEVMALSRVFGVPYDEILPPVDRPGSVRRNTRTSNTYRKAKS